MTNRSRPRKPLFPKNNETCPRCCASISASQVKRVDRDYGLCPHCGSIYSVEVD